MTVRGSAGRYSYERGQLEWVEGGTARVLRSPTLALGELLAIAEGLEPGVRPPLAAGPGGRGRAGRDRRPVRCSWPGSRTAGRGPLPTRGDHECAALARPHGARPPTSGEPGTLLAWTADALDPGLEAAAASDPSVRSASIVQGGLVDLVGVPRRRGRGGRLAAGTGWAIPLDLLAFDPAAPRARSSPPADRAAVADLGPGEALLGRTSADAAPAGAGRRPRPGRRGVAGGDGAWSRTPAIGGAELAVDRSTGGGAGRGTRPLPAGRLRRRPGGAGGPLAGRLTVAADARFRAPGETPYLRDGDAVLPQAQIKARFGEFSYRHGEGDQIEQDVGLAGHATW